MSWKQLTTKEVYRNHWMWVTEDEVETETGQRLTYGVVHKKPFALIIPWDGEKFTLVGQYRYVVDSFSWEFPQGHFEHDSIEETAKRELKEETGLSAGTIKQISRFWAGPGSFDQDCVVFLATDLKQGEHEREAGEESMQTRTVTLQELHEMIAGGAIKDAHTIAALGIFETLN